MAVDLFAQRIQQHVASRAQLAPDDDQLGVEQVAQGGHRLTDITAGVGEYAARAGVAGRGRVKQLLGGQLGAVRGLQQLDGAAAPASVSRQPRLPQRQNGPSSWMIVWPISPAIPPAPW